MKICACLKKHEIAKWKVNMRQRIYICMQRMLLIGEIIRSDQRALSVGEGKAAFSDMRRGHCIRAAEGVSPVAAWEANSDYTRRLPRLESPFFTGNPGERSQLQSKGRKSLFSSSSGFFGEKVGIIRHFEKRTIARPFSWDQFVGTRAAGTSFEAGSV